MKSNNEKEEPTLDGAVPQTNSMETDVNSVSSTAKDYTPQNNKSQGNVTDVENLEFPLENTDGTMQFENGYPTKDELRELINLCNIVRLNSKLHIYKDGIYTVDTGLINSKVYKTCNEADHSMVGHLINDIELEIDSNVKECSVGLVAFNNCILDTQDFKPKQFEPKDYILTSKLGIDYIESTAISNMDKRLQAVDSFFDKITCSNKDLEHLLYIMIGMICCRSNTFKFAFVLTGNNHNSEDGRSEFLELIERILGNSVSHENLRKLADIKSSLELYGKTCNISEEVERPSISCMDNLRKLIKGKELKVCNAHSKLVFTPYTTLLINVKEILDFGTALFGLKDYFKIIPFNAKRPIKQKILDVFFETETLQYIALQGIKAYCQAIRVGKLPTVNVVENETSKYFRDNNSSLDYFTENPINGIVCKSKYYWDYCQYCVDNNSKRISRANFGTEVRKFGYEPIRPSFKGKRIQCYVEQGFDIEKCRADYIQSLRERGDTKTTDKDIIFDNLVNFINGYDGEEKSDDGTGIFGFGENQELDFDLGTEALDL